MSGRRWLLALWVAALVVSAVLFASNLLFAEVNQDEGWYLYAARLVAQGRIPYVDFAITQGPLMPHVYAAAQPLVKCWGVAGGRLFTALLGMLTALGAASLSARIVPREAKPLAALAGFTFVGVNVYQSHYFTIVKTYALTGFLLVFGFIALSLAVEEANRRRNVRAGIWALLSGVIMAAAAGTRSSAVVVIAVTFVMLLVVRSRSGPARLPALWFWYGIGAAGWCVVLFVPFLLRAPQAVWLALVEYHSGREVGGLVPWLGYKAGFVSRVVQAYFAAVASGVGLWIGVRTRGGSGNGAGTGGNFPGEGFLPAILLCSAIAVTLVHFLAPFPYDDYQVMIYPLFAVVLSGAIARRIGCDVGAQAEGRNNGARRAVAVAVGIVFLNTAASFSSPINQNWFVAGRDRIWWPFKEQTSLQSLREAAAVVRSLTSRGDVLLTQDTYLAVESDRDVPRGLEMGPFSYFPDWPKEKARACHVLNREMMRELLEVTEAPIAALSGYSFAIDAPSITPVSEEESSRLWNIVESRYTMVARIDHFGQGRTTLDILRREEK